MSYVNMRQMLAKARQGRYAVGAFNIVDPMTAQGVVRAAEARKAPVIIQTSTKTVELLGPGCLAATVRELAGKAAVPVALHLDHCKDMKLIEACIEAGWSSVMVDASSLPFEENVRMTKAVVEMARPRDITVEGELGAIVGVEDDIFVKEGEGHLADPVQSVEFVKRTGVDVFAPAIGTAHGIYKGEPKIAFDRLGEIAGKVEALIAIHGGTGLSDEVFRKCIGLGGVKVNISTQIKHVFRDSFTGFVGKNAGVYEPVKIMAAVRAETQAVVESFIDKFGSAGKA